MTSRPIALVTGGSRGIGRAICEALAPTHRLLVGATSSEAAAAVADTLLDAAPFVADLTDPDAVAAAVAGIDRLDVLVHNAAVASYAPVAETPRAEWERTLAVNVVAVADLTRLLLPALRRTNGLVVTINSGAGFTASAGSSAYSASKFALRAFTDALRAEEQGAVRVTSVHPGRVDTDMQRELWAGSSTPYVGRDHLRPEAIAAAVLLAVEAGPDAVVDQVSVRPAVSRNPS